MFKFFKKRKSKQDIIIELLTEIRDNQFKQAIVTASPYVGKGADVEKVIDRIFNGPTEEEKARELMLIEKLKKYRNGVNGGTAAAN